MPRAWFRTVVVAILFFAPALIHAIAAQAQVNDNIPSRITQPIVNTALTRLTGNTHPLVRSGVDRGPASAFAPAERLMLVLRRSPQQEAALQTYLKQLQDPASANFRKFVTPQQFGQLYGASDADLATLQSWLRSQGFVINKVSSGRSAIEFSGNVGQVQTAFHTSIHTYEVDGAFHWANTTDPSVPSALAAVVGGVASLNDFKPHAQVLPSTRAHWHAARHQFLPDLTISHAGANYLFVSPGDAATIYNAPNPLNAHFAANQTAFDGTGVSIGVIERSIPDFSDLGNYQSLFGLPQRGVNLVVDGNADFDLTKDQMEALLDVELAQGLAPGSTLYFYTAGDTSFQAGIFLAAYRAIDDNLVNILSLSYIGCEADLGSSGNLEIANAWEQAAAQGITVVVSSGDSGSAGCDDPHSEAVAGRGLSVNGLASTPFNIAVGGTDFDVLTTKFSSYVGATNTATYTSALGYIPETTWNDSTVHDGLLAANTVYTDSSGHTNIVAGGGGASTAGDNSGTAPAGYAKPLWQKNFPPSNVDTVRDLPDVSLLAGAGKNHALWAVCADHDCQGSNFTISGVGGTSASAPAFAGMLAMVNQQLGAATRLGQANWVLYKLAQTSPNVFHVTAAGNNSVPCSAGSLDCGANGFLTGYNTSSGYNLATGLGSVDITNLGNNWKGAAGTSTTTTLTLDKTSFVHGDTVHVSLAVNPSQASGDVAVVNNASSQSLAPGSSSAVLRLPLIGGAASGGYSQFPGGSYTVYGNYGGDGRYAGSTSQGVAVSVAPEDSVLQSSAETPNAAQQLVNLAGTTVPLGTYTILRATPLGVSQASAAYPIADATGSVYFSDYIGDGASVCSGQIKLNATGLAELERPSCVAGAHTIGADYSGDLSYNRSTAAAIAFTVEKGSTGVALSSTANTISSGTLNLNVALTPSWQNLSIYPNDTVTFTNTTTNTVLGTGYASSFGCDPATCAATALTVSPPLLVLGANAITGTYSGDSNYNASGPSAPFIITCTAGCGNGTGQSLYISSSARSGAVLDPGGSLSPTVSVGSRGGFSGAVTIACTIQGKSSQDLHIPTCSPAMSSLTVTDSQGAELALSIKTTASTSAALTHPASGRWCATASFMLAGVVLLSARGKRQRWASMVGVLVCLVALGSPVGCGGGGSKSGGSSAGGPTSGGSGTPGTTADTYTVAIRATDVATGTLTAEADIQFVVE